MSIKGIPNIEEEFGLRKVACRMKEINPKNVQEWLKKRGINDNYSSIVSLIAAHHQGEHTACTKKILYTRPLEFDPLTGIIHLRCSEQIESDCGRCKGLYCLNRCHSVLGYTRQCITNSIDSRASAYFGFLMLVFSAVYSVDCTKSIYTNTFYEGNSGDIDISALFLHLYGYIEDDRYIAFPVQIKNNLNALKSELLNLMNIICNQLPQYNVLIYGDNIFKDVKKALEANCKNHQYWKRIQWLFCTLLVKLKCATFLTDTQKYLHEKAIASWNVGMDCTPEEWLYANKIDKRIVYSA